MINPTLIGEINRLREALGDEHPMHLTIERNQTILVVPRATLNYTNAHVRYFPDDCAPATVTRMIDELIKEVNSVSSKS